MNVTRDIKYIGVNDRKIDLFEGQYVVPNGMAYNSYLILDDSVAVLDTVDAAFTHEWLDNIQHALDGRAPDYLIVQHMEPDHSANIMSFVRAYPDAKIVSSQKAFVMMKQFFGTGFEDKQVVVGEGDTLCLGKHTLTFVTAPMVHWPEVIVTYDSYDKVLFQLTALASSVPLTQTRIGLVRREDTTLALLENTACRYRICLKRHRAWTLKRFAHCTAQY